MSYVLLVGAGGFFGSVSRYLVAKAMTGNMSGAFPVPTLTINLVGSLLLGVCLSLNLSKEQPILGHLLVIGFLGGFTTFSAFSGELLTMLQKQMYVLALGYALASVVGGVLLCGFGFYVSKTILSNV